MSVQQGPESINSGYLLSFETLFLVGLLDSRDRDTGLSLTTSYSVLSF